MANDVAKKPKKKLRAQVKARPVPVGLNFAAQKSIAPVEEPPEQVTRMQENVNDLYTGLSGAKLPSGPGTEAEAGKVTKEFVKNLNDKVQLAGGNYLGFKRLMSLPKEHRQSFLASNPRSPIAKAVANLGRRPRSLPAWSR